MDSARHVIGCHLTQDTRVQNVFDDVEGRIHQSLGKGGAALRRGGGGGLGEGHARHVHRIHGGDGGGGGQGGAGQLHSSHVKLAAATWRRRQQDKSRGAAGGGGGGRSRTRGGSLLHSASYVPGTHSKYY